MKARATLFLALTFASLLALSACAGIPSTSTSAQPTPTATPIATKSYTSTDGVYSIKYPSTWTPEDQNVPSTAAAVAISNPNDNDVLIVEPFTFHSDSTAQHILESAIKNSPFTDSKVDSATTQQTYPSGTWTVATGSTKANGVEVSAHLYMMDHAGHTIVLITFAPTASASDHQTKYFDPMLQSFTFLK